MAGPDDRTACPVALPAARPALPDARAPGGRRDRRRGRRLVPRAVARGRPGRLRHRPVGHPAPGGRPARRRRRPAVLSGPAEEVVSVAWSPDGAWLAYLVSPGGSICAELHVVRPGRQRSPRGRRRGPARDRVRRRLDRPGLLRLLDRPGRRTGRRRRPGRRRHRGAAHARRRRLPVGHRACPPTSGSCWPAAARAATGTSSSIDVATGVQRRALGARRPGRHRLRGRPVRRRTAARCTCAPRCPASRSPTGPVWSRSRCPRTASRARGAVVLRRPTPISTATRCAPTAPCSPCGTPAGSPSCWCTPCPTAGGAADRAARAGDAGLVAVGRRRARWSPSSPVRGARGGCGWSRSTAARAPAPLPSAPPRPDPALLVTPVRHDYVAPDGLPLSGWLYTPRGVHGPEPHGGQLPRRARRARSGRRARRSRRAWSPPGSPSSPRTCAARAASAGRS